MDLEEYALDLCPVPDLSHLTAQSKLDIENLWNRLRSLKVPSLVEQLEGSHPFRTELDDGLLRILGISDEEQRGKMISAFRKGALTVIKSLQQTMQS